MSGAQTVLLPDLGDFKEVEVIDVLVKAGDRVELETPLITLETEKATMDVPSTAAGVVKSVAVKKGDKVSKGSAIVTLEAEAAADASAASATAGGEGASSAPASKPPANSSSQSAEPEAAASSPIPSGGGKPTSSTANVASPAAAKPAASYDFDLVVLGSGPGGYTAAFRAADLGMKVALVERWPNLGGVCLNVGCIPSKALLHAAKVIEDAQAMGEHGVQFAAPTVDVTKLSGWKNKIVSRLTGGLAALAKQRKVTVIRGTGTFASEHSMNVAADDVPTGACGSDVPTKADSSKQISFAQCIIAAGSESVRLPGFPDDPRIIDSTGALALDLPKSLLVVGGGIIGLEMATVYAALGVRVTVVELTDGLIPGCDRDLVKPLEKRIAKRYEKILVGTQVTKAEALKEGIRVTFEAADKTLEPQIYDRVLLAVGRSPNGKRLNAGAAGVVVNERGFIPVDKQMRTNVPHIFAIGDIAGMPMLAHKATHEAKVAAEAAHGEKSFFDARAIPSVAYTDPEIAWAGLTETEAKAKNIAYEKAQFPWAASGRALALGREDGFTKLLFDKETGRILGGAIVGTQAGDLISEVVLAIEMGADAADISLTVHPHPTLSETVAFAAEAYAGTLTDLYIPKKK